MVGEVRRETWFNEYMTASNETPEDPKAAFKAALEKKQAQSSQKGGSTTAAKKSASAAASPGSSRRVFQRRSGSS